jgi:hypothetical protein
MRRSLLQWLYARKHYCSKQTAYGTAVCLAGLQICFGILLEYTQLGRESKFSPNFSSTSLVAISEFFKLAISLVLFYKECQLRVAGGIQPSKRGSSPAATYTSVESDDHLASNRNSIDWSSEASTYGQGSSTGGIDKEAEFAHSLSLRTYWSYIRQEISPAVKYGFAVVALLNAVINNLVCTPLTTFRL